MTASLPAKTQSNNLQESSSYVLRLLADIRPSTPINICTCEAANTIVQSVRCAIFVDSPMTAYQVGVRVNRRRSRVLGLWIAVDCRRSQGAWGQERCVGWTEEKKYIAVWKRTVGLDLVGLKAPAVDTLTIYFTLFCPRLAPRLAPTSTQLIATGFCSNTSLPPAIGTPYLKPSSSLSHSPPT